MKISILVISMFFLFQNNIFAMKQHNHHKHNNGMNGHVHDEKNMPGLKGIDTTTKEENDLKTIFKTHKEIKRSVVKLKNGIKTITESNNIKLREAIIDHVSMMVTRLEEGKKQKVLIQTTILDKLFDYYDQIDTDLEITDKGIIVIQTSANKKVVQLLQKHADEVSDMSKRGMVAVHERMMKNYKNN
jgi:ferritin